MWNKYYCFACHLTYPVEYPYSDDSSDDEDFLDHEIISNHIKFLDNQVEFEKLNIPPPIPKLTLTDELFIYHISDTNCKISYEKFLDQPLLIHALAYFLKAQDIQDTLECLLDDTTRLEDYLTAAKHMIKHTFLYFAFLHSYNFLLSLFFDAAATSRDASADFLNQVNFKMPFNKEYTTFVPITNYESQDQEIINYAIPQQSNIILYAQCC